MGVLTGKYIDGTPEDSRSAKGVGNYFNHQILKTYFFNKAEDEKLRNKLIQLRDLAQHLNCNMGQLALAWCVANKDISTVLLGVRNVT